MAEANEYFARRATDGFTAVHLHAVTKEVGPVKNVNGDEPFAPLDDILQPNEAYWRHVDAVLDAAEKHGLLAAVSALWIRWGGARQGRLAQGAHRSERRAIRRVPGPALCRA